MKLTLCGSANFIPSFNEWNQNLSINGHIIYSLAANYRIPEDAPEKQLLDLIHLRKIAESDGIVIINDSDYIGDSTKREILFACLSGKRLFATTQPNDLRDWGIGDVVVMNASALLGAEGKSWKLCERM